VSRIGDASATMYLDTWIGGPTSAVVFARKANVVVATYLGPGGDADGGNPLPLNDGDTPGLLQVARTAIGSVAVH